MHIRFATALILAGLAAPAVDDGPAADGIPTVPATRADLKQTLEDSKHSEPRLPLPPLTEEDRKRAAQGEWGIVNNGRMRKHYLPPELTGAGFTHEPEGGMTLSYPFQTMIFWIVSRGNNCTYCMGHQESKLASAGVAEDTTAALDGAWSEFTPAERAAFALAKKLTFEPHAMTAADLDAVREHYTDKQVLEIAFVAANFNAMNRWTGALRIPQEAHRVYLTPTAANYRDLTSRIAPLDPGRGSAPACAPPARRPALESRAEVEAALEAARHRAPRLPLVDESAARPGRPADGTTTSSVLPQWIRLLANFPKAGGQRIAVHLAARDKGRLDPRLRAEIAWIAARHDRAWYALDHARARLLELGLDDAAILAITDEAADPARRAVRDLARKLTVDPARIGDADVAALREHFSDHEIAEVIWHVTEAAFFDRVTEAAGLRVGR